jgi:hypothetical protein
MSITYNQKFKKNEDNTIKAESKKVIKIYFKFIKSISGNK